jgi:hypothetical protein
MCAAALVASCGAPPANGVMLYQGADRPDDENIQGPPPPSDYYFGPLHREVDTNGDNIRDRVEFMSPDGKVLGVGDDTNHDGKIDRYQKFLNGTVVDETRDTNFDGVLDLRMIDTDNDGTLDKMIQLPAPLNGQPVPPAPQK